MSKESSELKFLHDLASPISAAVFIADGLAEISKEWPEVFKEYTGDLEKMVEVLSQARILIHSRREALLQEEERV